MRAAEVHVGACSLIVSISELPLLCFHRWGSKAVQWGIRLLHTAVICAAGIALCISWRHSDSVLPKMPAARWLETRPQPPHPIVTGDCRSTMCSNKRRTYSQNYSLSVRNTAAQHTHLSTRLAQLAYVPQWTGLPGQHTGRLTHCVTGRCACSVLGVGYHRMRVYVHTKVHACSAVWQAPQPQPVPTCTTLLAYNETQHTHTTIHAMFDKVHTVDRHAVLQNNGSV